METGSAAIFEQTRSISAAGYRHGYYLPTEEVQRCLRGCSEDGLLQLAGSIIDTVSAGGYTAITFDWSLSEFVKLWLRDWAAKKNISLYSWDMQIDVAALSAKSAVTARLSELPLEGLLVTFPSVFRL